MIKSVIKYFLILVLAVVVIYLVGPTPDYEEFDNNPVSLDIPLGELDSYLVDKESKVTNIKPDNQAEIIWVDSIRKTEYSIVYMHGYSASKGEGEPIHRNLAKKYGCNLFLPRLDKHALTDQDAFVELTPKGLVESAKEAIAIGKLIGEKVIMMSTSTGGTLSIYLAANDPTIHSMVLMAPNIDIADPNSHLLNDPWGKQLMRLMTGSDYRTWDGSEDTKKYWTTKNRIEGLVALRELLDNSMTDDIFGQIDVPVCVLVYYKNEEEKDNVVSIPAMEMFITKIKTPAEQIVFKKLANANEHPLGSKYVNENWMDVQVEIDNFLSGLIESAGE